MVPSHRYQKIKDLNDGMIRLHEIVLDPSEEVQHPLPKESLDHRTT